MVRCISNTPSRALFDPANTEGQLIAASKVNGTAVYSRSGEKLGSIYDVMLEKTSGKASYSRFFSSGSLGMPSAASDVADR
jgi:hypothetical protein